MTPAEPVGAGAATPGERVVGPGHDVRLLPAAAASAVAAWAGTGAHAAGVREAAGVVLAVTAVLALPLVASVVVPVLRARRRGRGPRVHGLSALVLAGACAATVLGMTAAGLERREDPAVAGPAARGGSVVAELVVTGDPLAGRGDEAWQQAQVTVRVLVVRVRTRTGAEVDVRVPALVRGDASWAQARWGERRRGVLRLEQAPAGEAYAVVAAPGGRSSVLAAPRWWWRAAEGLRRGLADAATSGPGAMPAAPGPAGTTSGLAPPAVGDGAALLPGLVVGDTSLQPVDLVDDMRVAGLSHLSVVSGANITLVCGGVLLLVVAARGSRRLGAVLAGVALLALVVVARPDPSVLRAAVMGAVALAGVVLGRRGGGTSALCLAVVAVLAVDPWLSRAAGFRLSVVATAAIVVCAGPWARALGRVLPRVLATALAVPAAAQVAVTPVLVGLRPVLSPYALPANVLAAPAVPPATVLGLLSALLSVAHATPAAVVAAPARWCASWIAVVARTTADLPGASVPLPAGPLGAVVASAATLAALAGAALVLRWVPDRRAEGQTWAPWPQPVRAPRPTPRAPRAGATVRRPGPGAAAVVGAGLVVVVLLARTTGLLPGRGDPWPGAGWAVVVCDVGQGDSLLVRAGPSSAVVVDTGPEPGPVQGCLTRAGVTDVPLVVLTHLHDDHVGGLAGVGAVSPPARVWSAPGGMPDGVDAGLDTWAASEGAVLERPVAGAWAVVGAVRVDVLATGPVGASEGDAQDVNDAGLVLRVDTGTLVLLALGDVGADVQQRLLDDVGPQVVRADVTTVAHHGSADQLPELYAAARATVAVASAGRENPYGHPTDRALELLHATGARVLTTAGDGDVALRAAPPESSGPADAAASVTGPGSGGPVALAVRTSRRRQGPGSVPA